MAGDQVTIKMFERVVFAVGYLVGLLVMACWSVGCVGLLAVMRSVDLVYRLAVWCGLTGAERERPDKTP